MSCGASFRLSLRKRPWMLLASAIRTASGSTPHSSPAAAGWLTTFRRTLARAGSSVGALVRARWFVDSTLGFAAGFWLRVNAGGGVEADHQDLVAASWLRMPLSRGRVHDASIGLVLNVFDLDGDGWAEILVAREGYESVTMKLRKYQPQGFVDGDLEALQGC